MKKANRTNINTKHMNEIKYVHQDNVLPINSMLLEDKVSNEAIKIDEQF